MDWRDRKIAPILIFVVNYGAGLEKDVSQTLSIAATAESRLLRLISSVTGKFKSDSQQRLPLIGSVWSSLGLRTTPPFRSLIYQIRQHLSVLFRFR